MIWAERVEAPPFYLPSVFFPTASLEMQNDLPHTGRKETQGGYISPDFHAGRASGAAFPSTSLCIQREMLSLSSPEGD